MSTEDKVSIPNHSRYTIDIFGVIQRDDGYIPPQRSTTGSKLQYKTVYLDGKRYTVHRLVAQLFIPNPDNKEWVDHIDRNTHNNYKDNLRWTTRSENLFNRPCQMGSTRKYDLPKNIWIDPNIPNKYNVKVQINKRQIHIATDIDNLDEAIAIAKRARREYHGEYKCDE